MEKTKRKRLTRAEVRQRQQYEYDLAFAAGKRAGVAETTKAITQSDLAKILDAKIKLAQSVGNMIESSARAVIAFCGEVGLQR